MAVLERRARGLRAVKPKRSLALLRQTEKEYLSGPRWYDQAPDDDGLESQRTPRRKQ